MAGYHINDITKGVLGEVSKIQEELDELIDAEQQGSKIMQAVELADLLGAVELYAQKQLGLTLEDLILFKNITKRAFETGHRQ